jgi:hypothetical protein
MNLDRQQRLIEVYCDDVNRWTVLARHDASVAWTVLQDEDLNATLVLAQGVVTGELPDQEARADE